MNIKNIFKHILPLPAANANAAELRVLYEIAGLRNEISSLKADIEAYYNEQRNIALINERITEETIVHIMTNEKFSKPYVDFCNTYFEPNRHLLLVYNLSFLSYPFPVGDNVFEIHNLQKIDLNAAQKIIFHSLWSDEEVNRLYFEPRLLRKSVWIVWGADLYNAPREKRHDFVRSNFAWYCSGADSNIIKERYSPKGKIIDVGGYIFPVSKTILDSVKRTKHSETVIQINNSADKSTLEILDVLYKFRDHDIRIWTVVSYGDMQWKDEIIAKGNALFADRFQALTEYMPPEAYVNHIANSDILILNQRRQQGVGNTKANLYLGNKVFIRSDVSTYGYFKSNGIEVYDTSAIPNMEFSEFTKNDTAASNKVLIEETIDEAKLAKKWKRCLKWEKCKMYIWRGYRCGVIFTPFVPLARNLAA